jgi:hypothetical protein
MNTKHLKKLHSHMLLSKGWRFLRYVHLRDFIRRHADQLDDVCVAGAGLGFAELACALEFPDVEFYLTDVVAPGRPNYFHIMDLAMRWEVKNVRFGVWDLLQSAPKRFDAVVSTEVLEHIKDADVALRNQFDAARVAVYALAPFAIQETNANAEKRLQAYLAHEHFVCGFDADFFAAQGRGKVDVHGAYWVDEGLKFRNRLMAMDADSIQDSIDELIASADSDLKSEKPENARCMAIKGILYK